mgnify:CR=1 FL=1
MEQHDKMLSPEEQYAQLAPTLDTDGFSLYAAAEEVTGLKVYEEFPYEDNRGMFELADGHTLLRYLEAAYFGTVTWEIVPGTPYERAFLGEVDKTTPEYRAFYQKICAGAAAHIKKRIGKEMKNVKGPISEINKESFWDLIHDAKIACGQDMDTMLAYLKDRLVSMGPTQAQNFHDIIHAYEDLADKFGLWDAAGIMKERATFITDLWDLTSFFFVAPTQYDEKQAKKYWKGDNPAMLRELREVLAGIDDFSLENTERIVHGWIEQKGYSLGQVMNTLRLALVGAGKGPGMYDVTSFIGKEETLRRIDNLLRNLKPGE